MRDCQRSTRLPSSVQMIDLHDIQRFCHTKQRLHQQVHTQVQHFQPKGWEEGLEEFVELDRQPWSYIHTRSGWLFTCRQTGGQIQIRDDGQARDAFSVGELTTWLRSSDDRHQRLNELAVENWITRAYLQGRVVDAKDVDGYYRLA